MSLFKHLTRAGKLALERSLVKWQGIVDGTMVDHGRLNCACCQSFCTKTGCTTCPIKVHTQLDDCTGTPYISTSSYLRDRPDEDADMLACLIHIYLGDEEYKPRA